MKKYVRLREFFLLAIFGWLFTASSFALPSCTQAFELSTHGRYVIDACGNRFKLKSINWYGANDTHEVVGGLDKQPLSRIVGLIKQAGFNSVRLAFSNAMLHQTYLVDAKFIAANEDLINKTPLEIFDRVIEALTDAGIVVILNNHTTISEWCCGYDFNGLWHHPSYQSTAQWIEDWKMLAYRYQHNRRVAGMDLRNEVRTARFQNSFIPVYPNWGLNDENDWKLAATQAGNEIHKMNDRLLIIVEGINWTGVPLFDGYRPLLAPVKNHPIVLTHPHKLVYEAHIYGYTGPKHTGDDNVSLGEIRYSDMTRERLRKTLDDSLGYLLQKGEASAPVWLGEFGAGYKNANPQEKKWLKNFTRYLLDKDMDWAYWSLNADKASGAEETYGLLTADWGNYRNDWRSEYVQALLKG